MFSSALFTPRDSWDPTYLPALESGIQDGWPSFTWVTSWHLFPFDLGYHQVRQWEPHDRLDLLTWEVKTWRSFLRSSVVSREVFNSLLLGLSVTQSTWVLIVPTDSDHCGDCIYHGVTTMLGTARAYGLFLSFLQVPGSVSNLRWEFHVNPSTWYGSHLHIVWTTLSFQSCSLTWGPWFSFYSWTNVSPALWSEGDNSIGAGAGVSFLNTSLALGLGECILFSLNK